MQRILFLFFLFGILEMIFEAATNSIIACMISFDFNIEFNLRFVPRETIKFQFTAQCVDENAGRTKAKAKYTAISLI